MIVVVLTARRLSFSEKKLSLKLFSLFSTIVIYSFLALLASVVSLRLLNFGISYKDCVLKYKSASRFVETEKTYKSTVFKSVSVTGVSLHVISAKYVAFFPCATLHEDT